MAARGTRLYVGNLAYSTSEEGLREAFARDGRKVKTVFIATDRETGRPRGFAFVEMETPEDATAAIAAMDGQAVDGRTLKVNEAREREGGGGGGGRRPGGGGGGFRDRGGGGGGGGGGGDRGSSPGAGVYEREMGGGDRGGGRRDRGDRDRDRGDRDRGDRDGYGGGRSRY